MRIHPEGWPWIAAALAVGGVAYGFRRTTVGRLALLAALGFAFFFRDPERHPPEDCRNLVLSPADGKVVTLQRQAEPTWLRDDRAWRIGIFLNIFNVHVNRFPITGRVVRVEHHPGGFRPAFEESAWKANERRIFYLEDDAGHRLLMVQIAGVVARRTVTWVQPEQHLACGERFGLIRFGSRMELFLPGSARILTALGQPVRAGETPLALLENP